MQLRCGGWGGDKAGTALVRWVDGLVEGVGLRLRDGEVWEWSGDADPISITDAQPCVLLSVA